MHRVYHSEHWICSHAFFLLLAVPACGSMKYSAAAVFKRPPNSTPAPAMPIAVFIEHPMPITVFIEHHLLNPTDPQLHEYAALALTCKSNHALLGELLREDKWKRFQPKFLRQLDFVDMFIFAHNLSLVETSLIFIPTMGPHWHQVMASVRRDWDFVNEVVTVTMRSIAARPRGTEYHRVLHRAMIQEEYPGGDEMWSNGRWEFSYVYDLASDRNFDFIFWQMRASLKDHMQATERRRSNSTLLHRMSVTIAALAAVVLVVSM